MIGKRFVHLTLAVLAAGCLLFGGLLVLAFTDILATDAHAIEVTREWARLDPLPTSASKIDVTVEGSPFTREFTVTFVAPIKEIDTWLASSPGTASVTPDDRSGGIRIYKIDPGGGAQHAEVEVDEKAKKVTINAYWS